jgi:hypothetical protein
MEIRLSIENSKYEEFLALLETLDYADILNTSTSLEEPASTYNKKNRPSADEIEQLIIAKALRDAKAIERGELRTYPFDSIEALIADLNDDEE